uniref:C2H2-type domain-containing protein n=1 Tax=Arion vulgaris TaxID=1028688 RepID=A0A0B7ACD3_9EUPU
MSTFHRAPKPLGCGTCGETFRVRNLLLKHIDSHTQEEISNNKVGLCYCGECFEFFENVTSLQIHTMNHREQAVFVCGACGLQTQHRHIMVKHLECHVISNLLTMGSDAEPRMKMQQQVEADAGLIQETVEVPSMRQDGDDNSLHVKGEIMNADEETSYKCGVCQASFMNLTEALSHAESHQDEESQMVEGIELREGMEFSVLLQDSTVDMSSGLTQQSPVVAQSIERTRLLPPETLDE